MPKSVETAIVLSVFALIFGGLFYMMIRRAAKRTQAFAALAEANGLTVHEAVDVTDFRSQFAGLSIFDYGQGYEVDNVIAGEINGIHYTIADYDAWRILAKRHGDDMVSRENGTTKYNTPLIATLAGAELPRFDISLRSNIFKTSIFEHDVDMPLTEAFHEKYRVCCADPQDAERVQAIVTVAVQEAMAAHKYLRVECAGQLIMLHKFDQRLSVKVLPDCFAVLQRLATACA